MLHLHIITRKQAQNANLKKYFPGSACPKGHIAERYTGAGTCTLCAMNNSKKRSEYYKIYYRKNRNKRLIQSKEWSENNKSRQMKNISRWQKENSEKVRAYKSNYKHARRAKESLGATWKDVQAWKLSQDKVCYWCGESCLNEYHVDHYIPLSKGGDHSLENIVIACPRCNLRKSDKDPCQFAKEVGRLF